MKLKNIKEWDKASSSRLSNKFGSMEVVLTLALDEALMRRRFLDELFLYKL